MGLVFFVVSMTIAIAFVVFLLQLRAEMRRARRLLDEHLEWMETERAACPHCSARDRDAATMTRKWSVARSDDEVES